LITDDGRRVFFTTAEPLAAEDVNGKLDAYEYDVPSGTVHLISTGTDVSDSYYMEASADGHDVYFLTRQRIVGWDTDSAYDLYDARVGGGFPEPPTPPKECSGDVCQGAAPAPPAVALLGSGAFRGLGNFGAPSGRHRARCRRGRVRRRVHGRVRCVKKRHAHRAKSGRRASAGRGVR
jgi:hypothetical protein